MAHSHKAQEYIARVVASGTTMIDLANMAEPHHSGLGPNQIEWLKATHPAFKHMCDDQDRINNEKIEQLRKLGLV